MIGYITTPEQAAAIITAIREAFTSRDLPPFWSTGSYPIHQGEHAGKVFIPASDEILATPLRINPDIETPADFPECAELIESLGGLHARVDLHPSILINPNAPTDP